MYFPSTYVDRLPNHTSNVYKPASGRLEWTAHPNGSKMLVIYKPMPLNMLVLCSGNPNQNEARSFCTLHETNKQRNKQTNKQHSNIAYLPRMIQGLRCLFFLYLFDTRTKRVGNEAHPFQIKRRHARSALCMKQRNKQTYKQYSK